MDKSAKMLYFHFYKVRDIDLSYLADVGHLMKTGITPPHADG